jgi:DME family drug/metabolite transporter
MRVGKTMSAVARRRPGPGLPDLVMSGLLWGTGGLTGSLLGRTAGLSAISVAAYRLTIGGALIVAFLAATGRARPAGRAAWTRIAAVGVLAALYQGCYFTAVSLTSVPLATLVTIGTAPVIVLGAERVTGHRPGRLALAAAGLALIGLGLLVGLPSGFRPAAVLASAGMAVLAAAGFAAVTMIGSRPVAGVDEATVTGFGFTAGGLALMPLAAALGGLGFRPEPAALGLLLALGTGPTAVAYTLYFRGLRTAAPSTAALLSLLEPLTGTILSALILGQRLSATGIAGAAILAVAVILTVRSGAGGRVGGDDGGDGEPRDPRQPLAKDHQSDDRGQHGVNAHEQSEEVGRDPAQREQVDEERHGRGQDPGGGRAAQRGPRRRVPDEDHEADRHEHQRGQPGGRRRPLRAGHPLPDQPVEQDVAGPARGRQ